MKRTYNIQRLAEKHGFQEDQIEKVCRISDILEDISAIPFLSQRLSLYGGTALNLIHFPQMPRLSADIDFNYRHIDEDRDWGNVRDQIDSSFKQILRSQTYREEDIKIDPSYPLSRFTVRYVNHLGDRDSFKIETGYMRRIPILREDAHMTFYHIGADIGYTVTTPMTEELYANKLVTLLSRATLRDLYDAHIIAETDTDADKQRKCAVLESLMSLPQPLTGVDPEETINGITIDPSLQAVLRTGQDLDIKALKESVARYSEAIIGSLTENERQCIKEFYTRRQFKPELLELQEINPEIRSHPAILRALQQLK
jgi:predicted nucleotidyltransferase component of viral defense system